MQFKRRLKKDASIEISSLVDIVFLLLLFFVVTTTFKDSPGLEIELPETRESKGVQLRDLVISIAPGENPNDIGTISFQNQEYSLEELESALKAELDKRSGEDEDDRFVTIQADKNTRFELVHQVVTLSQQAGASGVSFPAIFKAEGENRN